MMPVRLPVRQHKVKVLPLVTHHDQSSIAMNNQPTMSIFAEVVAAYPLDWLTH